MREPMCANCGRRISKWAITQGVIGPATVSMLLCRYKKCNLKALKIVKELLNLAELQ